MANKTLNNLGSIAATLSTLVAAANSDGVLGNVTVETLKSIIGVVANLAVDSAVPTDDPGAATGNRMWIASEAGTYTDFGGIVIDENEAAFIVDNGTGFDKVVIPLSLAAYALNADVLSKADYEVSLNNIADKNDITKGNYNGSGVDSGSNNWIKLDLRVTAGTEYTAQGMGIGGSAQRFLFVRDEGTVVGSPVATNGTAVQTFTVPATATRVLINIANVTNIGLTPTDNAYANAFMVNVGATALPYEPYAIGIDANKVIGLQPIISDNPSVQDLTSFKEAVQFVSQQLFNKATAVGATIGSTGNQSSAQANWVSTDFIPVTPSVKYSTNGHTATTSTNLAIAWYSSGQAFISGVAMSGATSYTATAPSNAAYMRSTIANAVGAGSSPANNQYSNAFMVSRTDAPAEWQPYATDGLIDAAKVYGIPDAIATFAKCYYEYDPTAYTGDKERWVVYVQYADGSDYYIGFLVAHEYDMSDEIYKDLYRIINADQYRLVDGAMIIQSKVMLINGESECVYMSASRTDFTGGYHGDETLITADFFADGVKLATDEAIPLTACDFFQYRQKSTTHQAPGGSGPVPGHPDEATHDKITTFTDGGYTTFNRLTWLAVVDVTFWYHGISCVSKNNGTVVQNDYLDSVTINGDNEEKLNQVGAHEYFASNATTELSAHVKAELKQPIGYDQYCEQFIWDRPAADNKYYRKYTPALPPEIGEIWESIMKVKFSKT